MTNREAIERAMDALVGRGSINVTKAKAKAAPPSEPTQQETDDAKADAEAWNMLRHLSRIL